MDIQADVTGFENLTKAIKTADISFERVETKADDPMILYFTSGTTGYPKGVIHDYTYPLAHIVTAKYWQQAEDDGLHFTVAETGWQRRHGGSSTDSGLSEVLLWFTTLIILTRSSLRIL